MQSSDQKKKKSKNSEEKSPADKIKEYYRDTNLFLRRTDEESENEELPDKDLPENAEAERRKHIDSRKLWSDIVSSINEKNTENESKVKGAILQKIIKYKACSKEAGLRILDLCSDVLQYDTDLIMGIGDAAVNITQSARPLVLHEVDPEMKGARYKKHRENTEEAVFNKSLSRKYSINTGEKFKDAVNRPLYCALFIKDAFNPLPEIDRYGEVRFIMQDVVKLNSVFSPSDTYMSYTIEDKEENLYSYVNIVQILIGLDEKRLHALIDRALTGKTYSIRQASTMYIEAMIPKISFLDKNILKCCMLPQYAEDSYRLNQVQKTWGIPVVKIDKWAFEKSEYLPFIELIKNDQASQVALKLEKFPMLLNCTTVKGGTLLHLAAEHDALATLKILIGKGLFVKRNINGLGTIMHVAINKKSIKVSSYLDKNFPELYHIKKNDIGGEHDLVFADEGILQEKIKIADLEKQVELEKVKDAKITRKEPRRKVRFLNYLKNVLKRYKDNDQTSPLSKIKAKLDERYDEYDVEHLNNVIQDIATYSTLHKPPFFNKHQDPICIINNHLVEGNIKNLFSDEKALLGKLKNCRIDLKKNVMQKKSFFKNFLTDFSNGKDIQQENDNSSDSEEYLNDSINKKKN